MDGIEIANKKTLQAFIEDYLPQRYLPLMSTIAKGGRESIRRHFTDIFSVSAKNGDHGNILRQGINTRSRCPRQPASQTLTSMRASA
jgi:hypothetical protein